MLDFARNKGVLIGVSVVLIGLMVLGVLVSVF
jgi:hypothetical protein